MVEELDESLEGPEERRRYDRSRLIIDVFVDGHDATGVASTKDISIGGLYLNTKANLPEGTVLIVRIPFAEGRHIVAHAEVVYSNPGIGAGLRFLELSDVNRMLIEKELRHG